MDPNSGSRIGRRAIIKGMAAGAVATAVPARAAAESARSYAIVGCGSRARMFQDAIWGPHKDVARLVAACDTNPGRLDYVLRRAGEAGAKAPRLFLATEFDRMLRESKPDALIVTPPDAFHDEYIVRALEAGLDVITEKPMTIEAGRAQRIIEAAARSEGDVSVTFNYRYSPFRSQVKELLMAGEIGDILSVDFQWLLNTVHGADYFRRWHSNKAISGGLMVHKATHHFDLVNWWLSDSPVQVDAVGKREFYTPQMARRMGLSGPHQRCLTCPERAKCSFYFDVTADPALKALYFDNEKYDGYFRDQCVWRPEISIEDTMNVIVSYAGGATLNYSLNAFNAWEGYQVAFNGTKGRLEHSVIEDAGVAGASRAQRGDVISTRIIPLRGAAREIEVRQGEGGHGGGDAVMLAELFDPGGRSADPLLRAADHRSGAYSILVGVAANQCFVTGRSVRIDSLVTGLQRPDLPPMPGRDMPLPMPPRMDAV